MDVFIVSAVKSFSWSGRSFRPTSEKRYFSRRARFIDNGLQTSSGDRTSCVVPTKSICVCRAQRCCTIITIRAPTRCSRVPFGETVVFSPPDVYHARPKLLPIAWRAIGCLVLATLRGRFPNVQQIPFPDVLSSGSRRSDNPV